MVRPFASLITAVAIAFGTALSASAAPIVTLIETIEFDPDDPDSLNFGWYTLNTGDLEGKVIVGFAVDNSVAEIAFALRPGWSADVISRTAWDQGYQIIFNRLWACSCLQALTKTTGPAGNAGSSSFDEVFPGPTNRANLYWLASEEGLPIIAHETAGGPFEFAFTPAVAESTLLLFLQDPQGNIFASTAAPSASVPEPATLVLFSSALAFLAAARRRRAGRNPSHDERST